MAAIFISYAHEDRPHAETLARALEAQGWSVWWDVAIPAGRTFDEVIDEALGEAKCVIVMWSQTSVQSRYVRGEAQDAAEAAILVPVLIEKNLRIPRAFRVIQAADLVGWDGTHTAPSFLRLTDDIARLLGPPPIVEREEQERRLQEEAAPKRKEEEKERQAEEQAAAKRKAEEEEQERQAEGETKRKAEEEQERRKMETEARLKTEVEQKRRQEEAEPQRRAEVQPEQYRLPDGEPTLHKDGYHRFTQVVDARGNATEWAFFDVDGNPID